MDGRELGGFRRRSGRRRHSVRWRRVLASGQHKEHRHGQGFTGLHDLGTGAVLLVAASFESPQARRMQVTPAVAARPIVLLRHGRPEHASSAPHAVRHSAVAPASLRPPSHTRGLPLAVRVLLAHRARATVASGSGRSPRARRRRPWTMCRATLASSSSPAYGFRQSNRAMRAAGGAPDGGLQAVTTSSRSAPTERARLTANTQNGASRTIPALVVRGGGATARRCVPVGRAMEARAGFAGKADAAGGDTADADADAEPADGSAVGPRSFESGGNGTSCPRGMAAVPVEVVAVAAADAGEPGEGCTPREWRRAKMPAPPRARASSTTPTIRRWRWASPGISIGSSSYCMPHPRRSQSAASRRGCVKPHPSHQTPHHGPQNSMLPRPPPVDRQVNVAFACV